MKRIYLYLLLFSFFFLFNCSTFIKVKLLKPSEINIGQIKKINVDNFNFKGNWIFNDYNSNSGFSKNLLHIFFENGSYDYNPLGAFSGRKITELLNIKLRDNGYFKIIKNNNEDISELKKNGIDAILTGYGDYTIKDWGEWYNEIIEKNGIKIKNKRYHIRREVYSNIIYKIISTDTGLVIAERNNSISNAEIAYGYNEDDARIKLRRWKDILDYQVDYLTSLMVNQIAPHYVEEQREIRDGKSFLMKNAFEYAKRDFWEDARKNWEQIIYNKDSLNKDEKDDYVSALYNMAIYYEIKGEFDKSEEMFEHCYEETMKPEYLDYKSRIEKRKTEIKKLKQQNIDVKN